MLNTYPQGGLSPANTYPDSGVSPVLVRAALARYRARRTTFTLVAKAQTT